MTDARSLSIRVRAIANDLYDVAEGHKAPGLCDKGGFELWLKGFEENVTVAERHLGKCKNIRPEARGLSCEGRGSKLKSYASRPGRHGWCRACDQVMDFRDGTCPRCRGHLIEAT